MSKKFVPFVVLLLLLIVVIIAFFYAKQSAHLKIDFHQGKYVGAEKCKSCHQKNYDSWKKTYHHTMTQEASEESVLGNFDGSNQTYWGVTIRPIKSNGKFYFEYYNPESGDLLDTLEIKRTVGSRRYQQYLAQTKNTAGNYYRLELLWHIQDKRWIHLNGAFLGDDNQAFDNHTGIWNQNCIFCHNTGIQPNMTNYDAIISQTKAGKPLNLKQDSRFESHVSDLGIACESCHANGDKHIALNQNPIRKYYLHYTKDDDESIVNPKKLSAKRAMDICGQCHGQRTPKTYQLAREWMEQGPSYKPGEVLQSTVNPVWQESLLNDKKSDLFKQRFWKDGTPRLTAYEYQGLLQSQCHIQGELTCNDCHSMHDGDPKGMIKPENKTNKVCLKCHEKYVQDISKHTGHLKDSDGSLCYNCHMPKITYGIMTFHRSHKIESPDPINEFNSNKPNACVACHLDKTAQWVKQKSILIWPQLKVAKNGVENPTIQILYKLHSGDPVERAIAAYNLNYQKNLFKNSDKLYLIPHLLFSMSDNYPAIRRFSLKSLIQILTSNATDSNQFKNLIQIINSFDFIADVYLRDRLLKQAWEEFSNLDKNNWATPPEGSLLDAAYNIDRRLLVKLRDISLKESNQINIGE